MTRLVWLLAVLALAAPLAGQDRRVGTQGDSVSMEELAESLAALNIDRTSGQEGEQKAASWLEAKLRAYGISQTRYEVRAYLSWPVRGDLTFAASPQTAFKAVTPAFGGTTPANGVTAPLLWLPDGHGAGAPPEQMRGKVVVASGLLSSERAFIIQQSGAAGLIHVNDTDSLHETSASTVWGAPTPDSAVRLPTLPILSIGKSDGARLRTLSAATPDPRVRIVTSVRRDWTSIPLIVADLPGTSSDYILVTTHLDSWYRGMTDSAGSVAAVLEMARVLQSQSGVLRRGVRFAWWPGHSNGGYAGSTWYADRFWADLDRHCVAYTNIDGVGRRGSRTEAVYAGGWPGLAEFSRQFAQRLTGKEPPPAAGRLFRPDRENDSSFQGIGIPEFFVGLPGPAAGSPDVGPSGRPTYWHTPDDTLDKIDLKTLALDTRYRVAQIYELATTPLLPHRIAPVAMAYRHALDQLNVAARGTFDLKPASDAAAKLASVADRLDNAPHPTNQQSIQARNTLLIRLTHRLNSTLYTKGGRFDQDPASTLPILPLLSDVGAIATMPKTSAAYGFWETDLIRRRNAVEATLLDAVEEIERFLRNGH